MQDARGMQYEQRNHTCTADGLAAPEEAAPELVMPCVVCAAEVIVEP